MKEKITRYFIYMSDTNRWGVITLGGVFIGIFGFPIWVILTIGHWVWTREVYRRK